MADDAPEDIAPIPEPDRARRAGPTIDAEATEVFRAERAEGDDARPASPSRKSASGNSMSAISYGVVSAVSGAAAAALVIGAVWLASGTKEAASPPAAPPTNAAAIDGLASRVADIEARTAATPAATASSAPDNAIAGQLAALEKSVVTMREDLAALRAQSDKLSAEVEAIKATPRQPASAADLSSIETRLAQVERAAGAQNAEIAKDVAKDVAKPADDILLRRVVAASMLDVSVRQGEPFAAALLAAKSLAENPQALKPLDAFATAGVPSAAALCRELLTLVPKLSSPAKENATTGSGLVDRLEAGAAQLVRIERTDAVGNDRGAIVARVTAAALRNDSAEAQRELNTLAPADRSAAQAWLDKANARDAAIASSHQFAADSMSALAKAPQ
jgi:hypothetical protein